VAIAAVTLALTTVLAVVRPAAQEQAGRPVTRSGRFNAGAGVLEVRLPRTSRGVDAADLTVLIGGRPLDLPGLQAAWSQPAIGVGPLPVRFTRVGTGRYRLDWPPLPIAGRWRLLITSGSNGAVETTWRIT
jgi:copper transport protein